MPAVPQFKSSLTPFQQCELEIELAAEALSEKKVAPIRFLDDPSYYYSSESRTAALRAHLQILRGQLALANAGAAQPAVTHCGPRDISDVKVAVEKAVLRAEAAGDRARRAASAKPAALPVSEPSPLAHLLPFQPDLVSAMFAYGRVYGSVKHARDFLETSAWEREARRKPPLTADECVALLAAAVSEGTASK
jgi:hypothetical protein